MLDVMESVVGAAATGTAVTIATTCERPEPVAGLVDLATQDRPAP